MNGSRASIFLAVQRASSSSTILIVPSTPTSRGDQQLLDLLVEAPVNAHVDRRLELVLDRAARLAEVAAKAAEQSSALPLLLGDHLRRDLVLGHTSEDLVPLHVPLLYAGASAAARGLALVLGGRLPVDGLLGHARAHDLRGAVGAHRHTVEHVGRLHGALLMRDHDELRALAVVPQQLDEAADVDVVQGRLDLVEDVERAGARRAPAP